MSIAYINQHHDCIWVRQTDDAVSVPNLTVSHNHVWLPFEFNIPSINTNFTTLQAYPIIITFDKYFLFGEIRDMNSFVCLFANI